MTASFTDRLAKARPLVPGLAVVVAAVVFANLVNSFMPQASTLVVAVVLGVLAANLLSLPEVIVPGTTFAAKRLLRVGIVLLGFRLMLTDVLALGPTGLLVVTVVVTTTFFGIQWLGRWMGLSPAMSLLIATGYAICGASAIAAVEPVSGAKQEEVAFSVGLVTLFGTLAMFTLPVIGPLLGLQGGAFGAWVGASVHDVAQVVAASAMAGSEALEAAIVIKLTRVLLLAPIVAGVSIARRRSLPAGDGSARPPLVPVFVIGFLVAVLVRSTGVIPVEGLAAIKVAEKLLLTAALFGLGTGVKVSKLRSVGGRGLMLGAIAWVVIAAVSYLAVRVTGLG